jgi:hypothetical protein
MWDVMRGVRILIKKQNTASVIYETNLLCLINPSLAYVYYITTLSNLGIVRLKNFVLQNSFNLCI